MQDNKLVEQKFWEEHWDRVVLPAEMKKTKRNSFLNYLLKVFDRFFPKDDKFSILEIGGAPGQYLIYVAKNFPYKIHSLDYSVMGCKNTEKNFEMLGIQGTVYQRDLFSDRISDLPLFDIVYSLGFIEHFLDLEQVIERHLRLLKPGGILLIGTPNFLGINRSILKKFYPELLSLHNLPSMDIKNWEVFEKSFNLEPIFKGYIGGFEPKIFSGVKGSFFKKMMSYSSRGLSRIIDYSGFIRKFNSKYWSGYVVGVYKKPK
jgi:2-polyprenyl-3-methyl-5-hydroxy-6-metoxy-1,4-benzoquinol methylase